MLQLLRALAMASVATVVTHALPFVSVNNQSFQRDNKPYYFVGANYWYGSLLGLETDNRRGVDRLRKELDFLKKNGVTNLRLMAGAEGSGMINGVTRVGPSLQPTRGVFDEKALDGLDIVLAEMAKRQMTAVIFLSNNWEWSGGFQQYADWRGLVPQDMKSRKLDWEELRDAISRFYVCGADCTSDYLRQVHFVLDRTNKITGRKYTDDPTIMAWEIANEPRPMRSGANELYTRFLRVASAQIKSRDKNHLVTIGHEGSISTEGTELFAAVHSDPNVDYLTIHIWPKNWGWLDKGFEDAKVKSKRYVEEHIVVSRRLNKPLMIEEFGLPRDGFLATLQKQKTNSSGEESFVPGSATSLRDEYYRMIFSYLGNGVAGTSFWAFAGTARPVKGQTSWKSGDEWMGDPPMEEQGLNSVFDIDRSTWRVIRGAAKR